jgi:hypothetical protein
VYVVALTKLVTPIEDEAAALARDLGTVPYEQRLVLNGGLPAIVLRTTDRGAATGLLAKLLARGQGAVACDAGAVVPSERMTLLRHFGFEKDAVVLTDREGERLPYGDISALLRAVHRTRTETESSVQQKKLSMGRAIMSGGLMLSKNVASKERSVSQEMEQVLYVFRTSGAPPWLLRERAANYSGLGKELGPSSAQNFMTTITRLRELAPEAVYDERLVAPRPVPARISRTQGEKSESISTSSGSGVDLLAHVLALSISNHPPYR